MDTGGADNNYDLYYTSALGTTWHHYVFTFKENDQMEIYIDGSKVANTTVTTNTNLNTNQDFIIANKVWGDEPFDGIIDEFRVYNRKLTATEISALYNSGIGTQKERFKLCG